MPLHWDEHASKEQKRLSFRMSYLAVLVCILAIGLPGIVLIAIARDGLHVNIAALALGLVGGIVVGALLTAAFVAYFKLYVNSLGLRCFDFWGLYHDAAWSDIVLAKPFSFLGVRFLRTFRAKTRLALWVPVSLADFRGFREFVCGHVDASNPLVRELEKVRS
jgi:hypothetical protein